ncbi:phthiotriol/phenolphthiotriol dimycocerosates methyltransferase [Azorhizobium oxalatiphilum]|uniref:Phthiotriol/phenolphthiotriol dimycocerosates methyltransferase n=1 Tax=Azorhizobium oxalatiphilum TaxID=980631 RepID=A0A917F7V9_9HYPH|nr:class I SAM-dependent methyltransferase [Azorhizobium oxalatiphilum]GGF55309.1 phthiotriol/phenolphthiotriol dimycocerosates methyltransferase [Azorhizobium oxalatiphilum]
MASRLFSGMLDAIDRGAFPRTRKWAWRGVYNMLSRFWRDDDWRFMNYGFLPPGAPFALRAEDEPERAFIGLYQQAVDGLPVAGARVLEVGSGRGGGSRYIARYHAPAQMVGLDYSPDTVRRARQLNADTPALSFETGDAEHLPFPDGSFDIVVNIESSHCYADVAAFAAEVSRVLAPGGWFTFADMRRRGQLPELNSQLSTPGLTLESACELSPGVVAALDASERRKRERIGRALFMKSFITEFAGAKGSIIYKALVRGDAAYVACRYRKTGTAEQS